MKVIVNNLAIEYSDQGSGPVIVMLHGWQDDLHTFDDLTSVLISSWRVVRLDLPGFGNSEMPQSAWAVDNYVQCIAGFFQKINITPDVILGHSMGGRIVIKGIASKTFEARKVVLLSAAGIAIRNTLRSILFKLLARMGKIVTLLPPFLFWRNTLRKKLYSAAGSDYITAGALRETFLNIIGEDLSESAKKISVPTLLLWGARDTETPLIDGQRMSGLIPHSHLIVIGDAGHFVHREKPVEVAKAIHTFITN